MSDTVVYLGPTLSRVAAEKVLTAEYLPPICRGDLARLPEEVRFVGIVDGEFYQSLAVSPKELLPLLKRGVKVFGASSMGAARCRDIHLAPWNRKSLCDVSRRNTDGDDELFPVYELKPTGSSRASREPSICPGYGS
jgi:hypothetical protein